MPICLDEIARSKDSPGQFGRRALISILQWWWVRVLPPPGSLIWRFPGFIRPRCTAGATHHGAKSYYGIKFHRAILPDLKKSLSFHPSMGPYSLGAALPEGIIPRLTCETSAPPGPAPQLPHCRPRKADIAT